MANKYKDKSLIGQGTNINIFFFNHTLVDRTDCDLVIKIYKLSIQNNLIIQKTKDWNNIIIIESFHKHSYRFKSKGYSFLKSILFLWRHLSRKHNYTRIIDKNYQKNVPICNKVQMNFTNRVSRHQFAYVRGGIED